MFCKACNTWVDLNPKLRYIMKLWNEHRKQCDKAHEGSERYVRTALLHIRSSFQCAIVSTKTKKATMTMPPLLRPLPTPPDKSNV